MNSRCKDFSPQGMMKYWEDNDMRYNEISYRMIRDLELYIKGDCKKKLKAQFGDDWFKKGLPKKVYSEANTLLWLLKKITKKWLEKKLSHGTVLILSIIEK